MGEMIEYYNLQISEWFQAYYANEFFSLSFVVAFIYMYVNYKEIRYKFLLPVFFIFLITINPILYVYIFSKIIYWRLLWMLPTVVIISMALVVLLKKTSKVWMKWGLLLLVVVLIVSKGEYMFSDESFTPISNWEKLSQETIDVCDIMLEVDDSPRVVVPVWLSTQIRQYKPEISMLYGRNADYYIRNIEMDEYCIADSMRSNPPNYNYVLGMSVLKEVDFVVVETEIENWILEYFGYVKVGVTPSYIIYYREVR